MQALSLCAFCTRFQPDARRPMCEAFPNGIPDEILHGGFDHRQPFEDEVILFEPKAGAPSDEELNTVFV